MKYLFLTVIGCLFLLTPSWSQSFKTYTYYDKDSLKLDLFLPTQTTGNKIPLVIFVHGGGFSTGQRSDGHSFCQFLSKNGFAATISYTLYAKEKGFGCDVELSEKIKAMRIAACDLWQATAFLLKNCSQWHIDSSKIFIAGSSAGAETVLNACFWDYHRMNLFSSNLPSSFRYAGLISGSGALMDINLITKEALLPVLLAHGNADITVPYGTAAHRSCKIDDPGWLMLFGSHSIFDRIRDMDGNVQLITYCGGGHEFSGALFGNDEQYVLEFLTDVLAGKKFRSQVVIPVKDQNTDSSGSLNCN